MLRELLISAAKKEFSSRHSVEVNVAPISPTPDDLIERILDEISISTRDLVIDLGCGDGRWLNAISRRVDCACFGVEIDDNRLSVARHNLIDDTGDIKRIELIQSDIFSINLSRMTIIIVYLFRIAISKIAKKILKECLPGTTIIAVGFHFDGWHPVQVIRSKCGVPSYIYAL